MMKKNPQLLILIGAPGAGKSTYAKYLIRTEENWIRLCRDDYRYMQFNQSTMSPFGEYFITEMINNNIEMLLDKKCNVVIDATNAKKQYLNEFIDKFNHLADITFKLFDYSESELQERCYTRYNETGKYIPKNVLTRFINEIAILKNEFDFSTRFKTSITKAIEQNNTLPKAVICDLDGTLAILNGRDPYNASTCVNDELNKPVFNILTNYKNLGYKILLVSGRTNKYESQTIEFLNKNNVIYDMLLMRNEGDNRKDNILKAELFNKYIKDKFFVEFVLDDRNVVVDMWRKHLGLNCFQVNYGNF